MRAFGLKSWFALIWLFLFVTLLIFCPVGALFSCAAFSSGVDLFDPSVLSLVRLTIYQAGLSTMISVLIGLPLGLVVGKWASRGSKPALWAQSLLAIPYGIPTVVAAIAGTAWLGRSGVLAHWQIQLDWIYTLKVVILMHVLLNAPLCALIVSQAREQIPRVRVEAAEVLGADAWSLFRWIFWPWIGWALASAAVQIFGLCSMSFALVLLLGGGPPVQTLETALYVRMRYGVSDLSGAVACALWEVIITGLPWMILVAIRKKKSNLYPVEFQVSVPANRSRSKGDLLALPLCGLFIAPYLILFRDSSSNLQRLLASSEVLSALRASIALAVASSLGAVSTAGVGIILLKSEQVSARIKTWIPILLTIPSTLSALALGLGFWLFYGSWIDPYDDGAFLAIAALQITLFTPLAFRIFWPISLGAQKSLTETAWTLGASRWQTFWWVEWPRWRKPIFTALAMVAGASLGEVAAVSLFYNERLIPLPMLITRWMNQYRFNEAQGIALFLLFLCGGTMGWISSLHLLRSKRGAL